MEKALDRTVCETLPWADPEIYPQFAYDYGLCNEHDEWMWKASTASRGTYKYVQIGGHIFTSQEVDDDKTLFMLFSNLYFGDCGTVCVMYKDGKWFGEAHTS